jgi:DnaJ-class molecular chaperone
MSRDLYRLLRVSHTATTAEIKASYRRIAMELHPDRHNGCQDKMQAFKQVNEAYTVLLDMVKRREYDVRGDHRDNIHYKNRKVYAPSPPPEWKTVWNHRTHYDMHYGDGFANEEMKRFKKEMERPEFQYKSPIGKGFTFDSDEDSNPYSKAPQGPPKIILEYEETVMEYGSGKERVTRRDRIVNEMYSRRQKRQDHHASKQQKSQQQRYNASFAPQQVNECVIL